VQDLGNTAYLIHLPRAMSSRDKMSHLMLTAIQAIGVDVNANAKNDAVGGEKMSILFLLPFTSILAFS
jgi:hypothetical protein